MRPALSWGVEGTLQEKEITGQYPNIYTKILNKVLANQIQQYKKKDQKKINELICTHREQRTVWWLPESVSGGWVKWARVV